MPSLQSYPIKLITKLISRRMNSITSVEGLRAFTEKITNPIPLPKGVNLYKITIEEAAAEWIVPPGVPVEPVILYLHGGAWVLGLYNNHRLLAAHIGMASRSPVLLLDYRLAPEHTFPAALEDSLAAYKMLLKEGIPPGKIIIAGDSVGANLALAMLMSLRDKGDPLPAAAVCISPMTDLAGTGETLHTNKDALLNAEFLMSTVPHYAGNKDVKMPLISPHYGDMTGLPPLLVQAGSDEILLSDAERLAENAKEADVDVTLSIWKKMWHVWHINVPYLPEAKRAVDEIGGFIRSHVETSTAQYRKKITVK